MAFVISKAPQPSFSEAADQKKNGEVSVSPEAESSITRHVYLKSSSAGRQAAAAAAALDKDVVLRRIRHHKNLIKVRTAFQALLGGSSSSEEAATNTSVHEAWLLREDTFSSP